MGAIFYRPAGPFTGIRSRRLRSQNFCSMQWHPMKTQATNISDRFSEYYQTWKYDQKSTIRKSPLLSDFHKPSETNSSYYQNVTKRSENLRYDQNFSDGIYTSAKSWSLQVLFVITATQLKSLIWEVPRPFTYFHQLKCIFWGAGQGRNWGGGGRPALLVTYRPKKQHSPLVRGNSAKFPWM